MNTHYQVAYRDSEASNKTPPRDGTLPTSLSATVRSETAAMMMDAVETDFPVHGRTAETSALLKTLFPIDEDIISDILSTVRQTHMRKNGRWKGFPQKAAKKEKDLYGAFISVANAVRSAAIAKHRGAEDTLGSTTTWVDYHSKSPKSTDHDTAQIRPDCFLARDILNDGVSTANEVFWWLQIVAALEIKRKEINNWLDVIKQLIGYLRLILREQLDRRFVFGFTLGPRCMTVCLHDRSGVLLTSDAIDIHKQPRDFIRIIAAFAVLPPHLLGFDPSMKIYVAPGNVVPSYRLDEATTLTAYETDSYQKQWVIKMNDGTEYLTIKVMSIARARVMRGRATLVWAVVRYLNGQPSDEFFILKQSWRPGDVHSEGDLYATAEGSQSEYVGLLEKWEDIEIGAQVDETESLIRHNLPFMPSVDPTKGPLGSKRLRSESIEDFLHISSTDDDEIGRISVPLLRPYVSRVHSRVILSTYGWPLKHFQTLKELLHVIVDGVKGHEYLCNNGLLHRDISAGNILIAWCKANERSTTGLGTKGCIIDFDRSKLGTRLSSPVSLPVTHTIEWNDTQLNAIDIALHLSAPSQGFSVTPHVDVDVYRTGYGLSQGVQPISYILASIKHGIKSKRIAEDSVITQAVLGWTHTTKSFGFSSSQSRQRGSRTGTAPYMSAEILGKETYFPIEASVCHDAIHDIESFFWIVVHICITRNGPGGQRREELIEDGDTHSLLRRVVYCFFDADVENLAMNKRLLFRSRNDFGPYILDHFHPYFESIKPFIQEWFDLLYLAYEYRGLFEYHTIHARSIDILERAIREIPPSQDPLVRDEDVLAHRRQEIHDLTSSPDSGSAAGLPNLDASPRAASSQEIGDWTLDSPARKRTKIDTQVAGSSSGA